MNLDDADSDGYSSCDNDCDDTDGSLNLNDQDGDFLSTCTGDCDDFCNNNTIDCAMMSWSTCYVGGTTP